jgi:hypothetical protein
VRLDVCLEGGDVGEGAVGSGAGGARGLLRHALMVILGREEDPFLGFFDRASL